LRAAMSSSMPSFLMLTADRLETSFATRIAVSVCLLCLSSAGQNVCL